ncbi:MAG: iron-sulfur cluster assembly accessory protein [Fimbriimonadaceae bacterium]|nr:iron-sulfur cluster assembly accessory protein [Fimbriimonadaceae bacterium]
MSDFPVIISPDALAQAKAILARKAPDSFLRIGVKGGGCTGMEYVVRPETKVLPIDLVTEVDGLQIVCDGKSAEFLRGATMNWDGNLLTGGFRFDNPNAARSCGCGTSFTPKRTA